MFARHRTILALLGLSLTLLLGAGACDDQDDEGDPTDETAGETSGGW